MQYCCATSEAFPLLGEDQRLELRFLYMSSKCAFLNNKLYSLEHKVSVSPPSQPPPPHFFVFSNY